MTSQDVRMEALLMRMERLALEHPAAYRRRVFGLAALGFTYLACVVLVLLALFALAVASLAYLKFWGVKLLYVIGALLTIVVRSMWIKFELPQGELLTRADAPKLVNRRAIRTSDRRPTLTRVGRLFEGSLVSDFT